jgi:endonuclease YncB( thermonuclease family)
MSSRAQKNILPILILIAALAIWIFDVYQETAPKTPRIPPAAGSSSAEPAPTSPQQPAPTSARYEVFTGCTLSPNRGNDGDSFSVTLPDGRREILRLYFVDTPESAFKSYGGGENNHRRIEQQAADMGGITPQQAVEIGKKAKTFTLATLESAPFTIYTEWDSPFNDRRYHAFVEITQNGKRRFLHELLVEKGLARIHTKGAPLPDGTSERKHEDRLFNLQRTAKSNGSGAWGL